MRKRKSRAFTLIELLVVIAIIALLVSILLPSLTKAKDLAKAAMCGVQTKNMALSFLIYREEWKHLPWSAYAFPDNRVGGAGIFTLRLSVADELENKFGLDTTNAYTCPAESESIPNRQWWAWSGNGPPSPRDPQTISGEMFYADDYCFYTYLDGKDLSAPLSAVHPNQLRDDAPVATHNNLSSEHALLGCTCMTTWEGGVLAIWSFHFTETSYQVTETAYGDGHVECVRLPKQEDLFDSRQVSQNTAQYYSYPGWFYWWK